MVSQDFLSILDGLMLGDGSLRIRPNARNATFSYSGKHKYVAIALKALFENEGFVFPPKNHPYYYHRLVKKTQKWCDEWHIITRVHSILTEQYRRWYPEGKKQIPSDLILDPLVVKHWYYGDGGLGHHDKRTDDARFSTHGFKYEEVYFLSHLLAEVINFPYVKIINHQNKHMLYLGKAQIPPLLSYMGECDLPCYSYKWIVDKRDEYNYYLHNCLCEIEKRAYVEL